MRRGTAKQREQAYLKRVHEQEQRVLKAAIDWFRFCNPIPLNDPKSVTKVVSQLRRADSLRDSVAALLEEHRNHRDDQP